MDTKQKKKKDNHAGEIDKDNAGEINNEVKKSEKKALFGFPKHDVDPEKRARWIARVPRKKWNPSEKSDLFLCENHFLSRDIITTSTDTNIRRTKMSSGELKRKRLTDDAMPCIWPDAPEYLSKITSPRPTSLASSDARSENVRRVQKELQEEKAVQNTFSSLEELISKEHKIVFPSEIMKIVSNDYVLFYKLNFDNNIPKVKYSIQVCTDLSVNVCFKSEKITYLDGIGSIGIITTLTAINELFERVDNLKVNELTDQMVIDEIVEKLQKRFEGNDKISFLVEQLSLLFKKPNARRYSASLLAWASLIHSISPSCYKQIHKDGILTIPCPGHLRRLASAIDVDTLTLSKSCIAYISAGFKKISERERLVSVLLDEVYSH